MRASRSHEGVARLLIRPFGVAVSRHLALVGLVLSSCSEPATPQAQGEREQSAKPEAWRPSEPAHPEHNLAPAGGSPGTTVSVTITPNRVFVRGKSVEPEALSERLEALAEKKPGATIAVQADSTVPKARVSALVDALKAAGFSDVAVAVRPIPPGL